MENENYVLRDKLVKVRDELSVATKEITSMTEVLEAKDANLKEYTGKKMLICFNKEILPKTFCRETVKC